MKKALSAIIALLIAFLLLSCNGQIQNKGEGSTGNNPAPQVEAWSITQDRLDTETVMLVSTNTLITKATTDENVSVEQTEGGGKVITVTKDITQDGVTILKDSKVTFTPKNQASSASKAAKDTAEYEIVAEIKAKISSTSDSSGSTASEKKLNVSYKATTSDATNLTDIKTEEITTKVNGEEVYKSTSTPTALLVKMILAYAKKEADKNFKIDEDKSFYSMGKGWIYFKSDADNEYHKVNFTIEGKGIDGEYTITSKTFDGWCESSEEEGLKVSEHPAVKDEDTEMPLSDQDIIDLTAQLYAYFIRYIPKVLETSPWPQEIIHIGDRNLKFKDYPEESFFDTKITINGTITNSNYVISADLSNFPVKNEVYDIRIGGVSDENNSYVGGQATHAYITTSAGKEYSYNYLVDEIYKVCIRVFATARMAGLPIIRELSKNEEVINLDKSYIDENGLHYKGTINYSFTNKTFDASFYIDDTSSSLAQDVIFTGEGTINDDNKMINWTKANLEYFGECSELELKIINKLMEVEFKN